VSGHRDGAHRDAVDYRIDVGTGSAPIEEALTRLVVKNGWDLLELHASARASKTCSAR
jgi:hypothetical protein